MKPLVAQADPGSLDTAAVPVHRFGHPGDLKQSPPYPDIKPKDALAGLIKYLRIADQLGIISGPKVEEFLRAVQSKAKQLDLIASQHSAQGDHDLPPLPPPTFRTVGQLIDELKTYSRNERIHILDADGWYSPITGVQDAADPNNPNIRVIIEAGKQITHFFGGGPHEIP